MNSNIENLEAKISQFIENLNSMKIKTENLGKEKLELESLLQEKDRIIGDLEQRCAQIEEQVSGSDSYTKYDERIKTKITNALGKLDQIESML
ncbi:hypothetical protein IIC38_12385 [candidate division KSB1 bacterium]|nr:hypothetical protein [candidate division KSB1 bacterium]